MLPLALLSRGAAVGAIRWGCPAGVWPLPETGAELDTDALGFGASVGAGVTAWQAGGRQVTVGGPGNCSAFNFTASDGGGCTGSPLGAACDGEGAASSVPASAIIPQSTTALTWAAWVWAVAEKKNMVGHQDIFTAKIPRDADPYDVFSLYIDHPSGKLSCGISDSTLPGSRQTATGKTHQSPFAGWVHAACTWDGNKGRTEMWVDGDSVKKLTKQQPYSTQGRGSPVTVGYSAEDDTRQFVGRIAQPTLWVGKVLTEAQLEVLALGCESCYHPLPSVSPDLTARYIFDCVPPDPACPTVLQDKSPYGNDGTVSGLGGTPTTDFGPGVNAGQAVVFVASQQSQIAVVEQGKSLTTTQLSVSLWYKAVNSFSNGVLIGKGSSCFAADKCDCGDGYCSANWHLRSSRDTVQVEWPGPRLSAGGVPNAVVNDNFQLTHSLKRPRPFNLGTWYYVAVTYDSQSSKIYLGCSAPDVLATDGQPLFATPGELVIGRRPGDLSYLLSEGKADFWDGAVDSVRIYNGAISEQRVRSDRGCTSEAPTGVPRSPSFPPTSQPTTSTPTAGPERPPTASPTWMPPSAAPSGPPSGSPLSAPTAPPATARPTGIPSVSAQVPTVLPCRSPSVSPFTVIPTHPPAHRPSTQPTQPPSKHPTGSPTSPTERPTEPRGPPSTAPSQRPTLLPSAGPSERPTTQLTPAPTIATAPPTWVPQSSAPSSAPRAPPAPLTMQPTGTPTDGPSRLTVAPSVPAQVSHGIPTAYEVHRGSKVGVGVAVASGTVSAMAGGGGGGSSATSLSRLALITSALDCPSDQNAPQPLDMAVNPLQLHFGTGPAQHAQGALVGNSIILSAVSVCVCVGILIEYRSWSVRARMATLRGEPEPDGSLRSMFIRARVGWLVIPMSLVFGGVAIGSFMTIISGSPGFRVMATLSLLVVCGGFFFYSWRESRRATRLARYRIIPAEEAPRGWRWVVWGDSEWVPRPSEPDTWKFMALHALVFDGYRGGGLRHTMVRELIYTFAVAGASSWRPRTPGECRIQASALAALAALWTAYMAGWRPYIAPYENVMDAFVAVCEAVMCAIQAAAAFGGKESWEVQASGTIGLATVYVIVAKTLLDLAVFIKDMYDLWVEHGGQPGQLTYFLAWFFFFQGSITKHCSTQCWPCRNALGAPSACPLSGLQMRDISGDAEDELLSREGTFDPVSPAAFQDSLGCPVSSAKRTPPHGFGRGLARSRSQEVPRGALPSPAPALLTPGVQMLAASLEGRPRRGQAAAPPAARARTPGSQPLFPIVVGVLPTSASSAALAASRRRPSPAPAGRGLAVSSRAPAGESVRASGGASVGRGVSVRRRTMVSAGSVNIAVRSSSPPPPTTQPRARSPVPTRSGGTPPVRRHSLAGDAPAVKSEAAAVVISRR
eukprot:TRINITY_DN34241_c0_g1_i3.p1 TRINITY_DN34241_c0_g1~~TRINITY_DN34241_c0_g1_i3.p1  ORF type:complete len:1427 (+),score=194.24 TRINITY_DN34241_c0_g1_i3:76-4281(+)